jgi:hypothetical protein
MNKQTRRQFIGQLLAGWRDCSFGLSKASLPSCSMPQIFRQRANIRLICKFRSDPDAS